jgi:hypothetical protein
MTSEFKIGDRVMYQAEGKEPQAGNITDIAYNESGEPEEYIVKLDDEQIIACSIDELAHYDLDKL